MSEPKRGANPAPTQLVEADRDAADRRLWRWPSRANNSAHPDNGGKAQFFESFGFWADRAALLIDALRAVAQTGEVVESVESRGWKRLVW